MSDQQWWQGGDAQWRPGPVPAGFRRGPDGRWYPDGTGAAPPTGAVNGGRPGATGAAGAVGTTGTMAPPTGATTSVFGAGPGPAPAPGGAPDPATTAAITALASSSWAPVAPPGPGAAGAPTGSTPPVAPAPPAAEPARGLRAWPRSAKVTAAALGLWALVATMALGAPAEEGERADVRAVAGTGTAGDEAGPTTTEATTTTTVATTTTAAPTTTAPPTTAAPATTAPPPPPTTAAPAPPPTQAPAPPPTQAPAPAPQPAAAPSYDNCDAARAAGAAPVRAGDPGYGRHLDRDGDGVGCE
jgi:hypothetical protein